MRFSLIMLITVHGTTPKYSSSEVQHWMALMAMSVCSIQPSITAPSFAIFMQRGAGTSVGGNIFFDGRSFACAAVSSSFIAAMRPRISERSMGSTEMPRASRIFSL